MRKQPQAVEIGGSGGVLKHSDGGNGGGSSGIDEVRLTAVCSLITVEELVDVCLSSCCWMAVLLGVGGNGLVPGKKARMH